MSGKNACVLVVDDHLLVCEGLTKILETAGFKVRAASCAIEAVEICKKQPIDIALVDARMPDVSGIELIGILHKNFASIKVVGITSYDDAATLFDFTQAGVLGILIKPKIRNTILIECVNTVLKGNTYFPEAVRAILDKSLFESAHRANTHLSKRELEIVLLMSKGLSAKLIAEQLDISANTVIDYQKRLLEKTNAKNSSELINFIHRNGLLS